MDDRRPALRTEHATRIFETDAELASRLARFVVDGLAAGDRVVVITTSYHRHAMAGRLESDGVSLDALMQPGRLQIVDVLEILDQIVVEGEVSAERFGVAFAPLLPPGETAQRVWSEAPAILVERSQVEQAVRVEQLTATLADGRPIDVTCAYHAGQFQGSDGYDSVRRICREHARVETEAATQAADVFAAVASALGDERTDLQRRLRDVQREHEGCLEAERRKDVFLAMLGHELRNPLAPIMTALQLMKLRGDDTARRERGIVERQVHHLARLVDDLLDVSRITRGKVQLRRQRFEVAAAAARAVEMVGPLIVERAQLLTVDISRSGLTVDGDELRIAQVLANLLRNAAKYTDPGGRVTLRAREDGDAIEIVCEDTGAGIPAYQLPQLFDLFSQGERTLDRAQGGLGLGLSLARSLTELHGGTITAASAGPGMGSIFTVRLPRAAAPARPIAHDAAATEAAPAPEPRQRIMVVDGDQVEAHLLASGLTQAGYTTLAVYDAATALASIDEFHPDVVVVDLDLPAMDGFDFARQLRAQPDQQPALKLIALTTPSQKRPASEMLKSGFNAHVPKPSSVEQVIAALQPAVN